MTETLKLDSGSRIDLTPAGGPWFDGKTYFAPGEYGWRLIDKSGALRGSGVSPSREEAIREATGQDQHG
jgi:hypothetical protein